MSKSLIQKNGVLVIALIVAFVLAVAGIAVAMVNGDAAVAKADPATESGFYLVGGFSSWDATTGYKLSENPNNAGEYFLDFTMSDDTSFKVAYFNGTELTDWYPDEGSDYGVDAGNYTIYFRPNHNYGAGWYWDYFYVAERQADPEPSNQGGEEPEIDLATLNADPGVLISFYNYDGSLISVETYDEEYGLSQVPTETVTPDPSWGWENLGWKCNACGAVVSGTGVANWVMNTPGHIGLMGGESYHGNVSIGFTSVYDTTAYELKNITFEPIITTIEGDVNNLGVISRTIDPKVENTVTVTYNIVHNDGIHALLLVPDYDTTAFTLTSANVVAKNNSALGTATITGTDVDATVIKVLWENTTENDAKYTSLDSAFLTLTFTVNGNAIANGMYDFGLKLHDQTDNCSAYYYITGNENAGQHEEIAVHLKRTNTLMITRVQDAEIVIGYTQHNVELEYDYELHEYILGDKYVFTYSKQQVAAEKVLELNEYESSLEPTSVQSLKVYFTYKDVFGNSIQSNGGAISVVWYQRNNYNVDEPWTLLESAPGNPGEYKVEISAAASSKYYAVEPVTRYFDINYRILDVQIDDKSSDYGEAIKALTYSVTGSVCEGDSVTITLSTTATSSSNPGTYPISGNYTVSGGFYVVRFHGSVENSDVGIYTINKAQILLKPVDGQADYTGSQINLPQTAYTITSEDIPSSEFASIKAELDNYVSILTTSNVTYVVNAGVYEIHVNVGGFTSSKYDINYENGTFTVNSMGLTADYIKGFFSGDTQTYSGNQYDLLIVDSEIPAWIAYSASGNLNTNAGSYPITVTVTLDTTTANNYTNGVTNFVWSSITGTINKKDVTLTANNVNRYYGQAHVVPNFTVTGTTEELDYSYAIKNSGTTFTPNAETPVGEYDIVVTEGTNPNFNVTYVNGKYNVNKATATASVSATDVYYNRPMDVTSSGSVNTLTVGATVKYYSDENCTEEVTPVNVGTYWVKSFVTGNDNYNGATSTVSSFEIVPIALEGVTFTYTNGTFTWTAVANDVGDTANEISPLPIKSGDISYEIYDGDTLIDTVTDRTFTATSATTYKVVAVCTNGNYLTSTSTTVTAYAVSFDEGTHSGNPDGEVSNMPATQYIFAGQKALAPATAPSVEGCTFSYWGYSDDVYDFDTEITGNITIVAVWDEILYTITFKFLPDSSTIGTDKFTYSQRFGEQISFNYTTTPTKTSTDTGISYVFDSKWMDEDTKEVYNFAISDLVGATVTGNRTFVAVFREVRHTYTIRYYMSSSESTASADYTMIASDTITYGDAIAYRALSASTVAWFKTYGWFADYDRTEAAPATMPADNLSVYGGYMFDIGAGDINADGAVTADDITLYRQWVVGGYEMTVVENGTEWETVNSESFDIDNVYFVTRVADNNGDNSFDIRDVSVTRMAVVGGYAWDITSGEGVTGHGILRGAAAISMQAFVNALNAGSRVTVQNNLSDETIDIVRETNKNIYIDLRGSTLTVKSLSLITNGNNTTISIKNGTIYATNGITLVAPNGNVIVDNVTAYVNGTPINLQAANNSLHFARNVKFYTVTEPGSQPAPATVNVEGGTHVVFEEAATIDVKEVVVTENFVASETASITLNNKTETTVEIVGNSVNEINDSASLAAAGKNGGEYTLVADIINASDVTYTEDVTIDLNGHTITFASWGFEVRGATLTITGNGNVSAAEACLYAQYEGSIVINGGTYTSTDNYVIGTHGSAGRGGNVITINAGTFNGSITSAGYVACGIYVANSDTVTVNGGTFNVTNGVGILARSGNTTVGENAIFDVTGTGLTGKVGDAKVNVPSGAVLVLDYAANYPGGDPTLVNDTSYEVYTVVGSVAELNAASGNVVLGANITTDSTARIIVTNNMTLDLNGYTITSTDDVAIRVNGAVTLTIKGSGNVNAQEMCVMAFAGATIIINGGTYNAYDNAVFGTNGNSGNGGNVITINAGTFNGTIQTAGYVACGIYVANSDTVTVNGGTFNVTNGVGILARSGNTTVGENAIFNVTGTGLTGKVGDAKVNVPSGAVLVLDYAANYPGGDPTLVNDTAYEVYTVVGSVAELNAASGNVVLGANITTDNTARIIVTNNMTLDLNGYAITSTDDVAIRVSGANGALTIKGNGTVNAQEMCVMAFSGASFTINGGTYNAYDNAVFGTNGSTGYGGNTIVINAGTFNGAIQTAGYVACGIYVANSDVVTVNGGTFNIEGGCGILSRSGVTTVGENVVINVSGTATGKVGDSRVVIPAGQALVLDEVANYPAGAPTLNNASAYDIYVVNAQ